MDRLGLAVLAAVLSALLAAAPVLAAAAANGVVYVSGPSHVEVPIYYTVVNAKNVSIDANGTYVLNVSVPSGWTPEAVIVNINTNETGARITALDANGTALASADIVPLSTGYYISLPGNTSKVKITSLGAVWHGTITVLVESSVKFDFEWPQKITVVNGTGKATVKVKQVAGPPGQIFIVETEQKFDVYFDDPTPEYTDDHMVETTGAGWSADVPMVVLSSAAPGTFKIPIYVYFKAKGGVQTEVAEVNLGINLPGGGGNGGSSATAALHVNAKWLGLGIIFLLFLFLLAGGKGRRGIAAPGGILLLLLLIGVAALALGLVDVDVHPNVDWKAIGVGVIALLMFLFMAKPGMAKKAAERLGLS